VQYLNISFIAERGEGRRYVHYIGMVNNFSPYFLPQALKVSFILPNGEKSCFLSPEIHF
jgi:hypothetical protein